MPPNRLNFQIIDLLSFITLSYFFVCRKSVSKEAIASHSSGPRDPNSKHKRGSHKTGLYFVRSLLLRPLRTPSVDGNGRAAETLVLSAALESSAVAFCHPQKQMATLLNGGEKLAADEALEKSRCLLTPDDQELWKQTC